jgi:hypothetical protein
MRFRFIEDRRADYPVTVLCDVLGHLLETSLTDFEREFVSKRLEEELSALEMLSTAMPTGPS